MVPGEKIQLTREGYESLVKEKEELKNKLMTEIAERIKEARELGDLSENSEYEEAKNEQGKIDSRIKEIDYILENAEIIDESESNTEEINLGNTVIVRDLSKNIEETYKIVNSQEADIFSEPKKISSDSPLGKALLKKRIGDKVKFKTPSNKIKELEIIAILKYGGA
ncbi:transcription elongation factor GreA [Marinitoga sp. 1135]|uniref:Transcription elongation factor GreA n=1 Tax=Marinitoga piezophila (strain DSM 14283 / JCM 11233 / KA3) TaxID=443254 RepID=H2J5X9_MARPK|nr:MULTISPECIES: transcription elongation factor GreA [Marinitoga]AEX86198.1 transcription elongation factor GreA [Marinitoga piezophila KA3]APT76611.1 transcription elongation factor GreA [Marinitoga sp. 1137]NUU96386.1 transcription elongation factor GreA [Marinitoga sp. 1135]NUU98308.1 transcription elongation factor GreA [Marinitoga sp. 1138]